MYFRLVFHTAFRFDKSFACHVHREHATLLFRGVAHFRAMSTLFCK